MPKNPTPATQHEQIVALYVAGCTRKPSSDFSRMTRTDLASHVIEKGHETEIHVQLLVAVE